MKKSHEKIINLPFPGITCEGILPCELKETHLKKFINSTKHDSYLKHSNFFRVNSLLNIEDRFLKILSKAYSKTEFVVNLKMQKM